MSINLTGRMLLAGGVAIICALPLNAKEFRIAAGDGAGGAQDLMGQAFIAALERESGGEHTGKIFLNSQLGSEEDTVTAASLARSTSPSLQQTIWPRSRQRWGFWRCRT